MGSISRVLVSGGCGFIGSHLVDSLLIRGYDVGIIDDLSTGEKSNLGRFDDIEMHLGDVSDFDFVKRVTTGYDAIFHQAALVSVARSIENPLSVNRVNVDGTLNLLRASLDSGIRKFIYASSSSVYGESETLPKSEEMKLSPVSPYAASKLAAENYCRVFAKVYGLDTVSLRYFNVYGPRQKVGEYSGVIPKLIGRIAENKRPIIYGDGEQTRDFTYVGDVVRANLLCLEKDPPKGEVFNIGSGTRTSVNQLADLILQLVGKRGISPEHVEPKAGDIRHSLADLTKAHGLLGYAPAYDLRAGLTKVIEWLKTKTSF